MITKESLQKAQESVNEAVLRIKQLYSNSSTAKNILLVVEGKDDVPFYASKAENYIPDDWRLDIIRAKNRKKVVETYRTLDWSVYSKEIVYFFIDRDLSDYTGEDTPNDTNVFVTTKYAIENELCTVSTFVKALKYYCDLIDIDESDEDAIRSFFHCCWEQFVKISEPIMAYILYWKMSGINSNYSNFKIQHVFDICSNGLFLKPKYLTPHDVIPELFNQSGLSFSPIDYSPYASLLNSKHSPDEYIRGKYVLTFFSKTFSYIVKNSSTILPSNRKAKDSLGLGYDNTIAKLCGIMKVPNPLHLFFVEMQKNIDAKSA